MTEQTPLRLPMAMFPLGTVLFPHVGLPLHVFEPRYRALVDDCLRAGRQFGVVLIERGHEVGGGDTRFGVGTVARIVEEARLPDGRWLLGTVGTRRIRIATWLPDDPYPVALVEDVAEVALDRRDVDLLADAERAVRRGLALQSELGEPAVPAGVTLDQDPAVAQYQLCAVAPVGPVDRQRLLEAETPSARLRLLHQLAAEAAEVLAYRLSAG